MARNSASKLKHWLHQLSSSNDRTRKRALDEVSMLVCHEGFVHKETADVVPYLIELLQKSHVKGKDAILALLADIAWAYSEVTWNWHMQGGEGKRPMTEEHLAVGKGILIFVALLNEFDIAIQLQAANVLSQFPEREQELQIYLVQAYMQAKELQVQANLILALGELLAPVEGDRYTSNPPRSRPLLRSEEWNFFEHIWQTTDHELLIFCASLVIARFASKNTPQEVSSFLVNVMTAQNLSEELRIFQKLPCVRYYSEAVPTAATQALKELERE